MNSADISREIALAFEYSYLHDDWVEPLDEVLKGISAEQAMQKMDPDSPSICEIVLHMAVWNENIVERVRTGFKSHPSEGSWPVPTASDPVVWEAAKQRLVDAIALLQEFLRTEQLEVLMNSPYGLADVLVRLIHNGYHIGQISKMR